MNFLPIIGLVVLGLFSGQKIFSQAPEQDILSQIDTCQADISALINASVGHGKRSMGGFIDRSGHWRLGPPMSPRENEISREILQNREATLRECIRISAINEIRRERQDWIRRLDDTRSRR